MTQALIPPLLWCFCLTLRRAMLTLQPRSGLTSLESDFAAGGIIEGSAGGGTGSVAAAVAAGDDVGGVGGAGDDAERTTTTAAAAAAAAASTATVAGSRVGGVAIATCCHHVCNWRDYAGREFLARHVRILNGEGLVPVRRAGKGVPLLSFFFYVVIHAALRCVYLPTTRRTGRVPCVVEYLYRDSGVGNKIKSYRGKLLALAPLPHC